MFLLVTRDQNDDLQYWSGGDIWSSYSSEAVRFVREEDGTATIAVLKKALQIPTPAYVVPSTMEFGGQ